jgi:hypothetical protein
MGRGSRGRKKRGWRRIVVDGQQWRWRCGWSSVLARGPNGERLVRHLRHRFDYDGGGDREIVKPRDVARWIRTNFGSESARALSRLGWRQEGT